MEDNQDGSSSQGNCEIAIDLARRGFPVFPITRKETSGEWTPIKSWQDKASTDQGKIQGFWQQFPDARVGLICGEKSGFTVLDVDCKNGKDGCDTLRQLGFDPDSLSPVTVKTPSGGLHIYFRFDPRVKNWVGKLGVALDTRNTGGYVLAPGSWKNGARYEPIGPNLGSVELPKFPEQLIPPPDPDGEDTDIVTEATDDQCQWAEEQLAQKVMELVEAEPGTRNATLNNLAMWTGGAAAHGFISEDQARASLEAAWQQLGKPIREFNATFKSAFPKGMKSPLREYPLAICDSDFDDLPVQVGFDPDLLELLGDEPAGKVQPVSVGQGAIMRNDKGTPVATLHNAIIYLSEVNRKRGLQIRFNEFTGRDEWVSGLIGDADAGLIRVAIEQGGMRNVGSDLTGQAIRAVAQLNAYHPVQEWLGSLPAHDGVPRIGAWLSRYLGASETAYTRATGRAFLIGMVARVMRPGCKLDTVLVLGGSQGIGKSTACRILAGEWTGDNLPSIREGSKEAALYLRGHWLVEMAELSPSRKSEAEDLKAFLSRSEDETRAPYARRADVVQRQCVFVGTTNETEFLRDMTGGRRFWPIECGSSIDLEGLARDRAQLFSEALAAFRVGENWHLRPEIEALAAEAQETAREQHPWESEIRAILECGDDLDMKPRKDVSIGELLRLLGVPVDRQTTPQAKLVAGILRRMGWQVRVLKGKRVWQRQ